MSTETTTPIPRTQDEVVAAFKNKTFPAEDFLGFGAECLACSIDFDHIQPFLKEDATVTREEWHADAALTVEAVKAKAVDYLDFAWGKAADERGISAERSVIKLTAYAWLMGDDALLGRVAAAPYADYGAPKLAVFAEAWGAPVPDWFTHGARA